MAASVSVALSKKSQESFIEYYKQIKNMQKDFRGSFRSRMEQIDKVYQREMDLTKEQRKAKVANQSGDADRLQNITVPVVMPQVEAAVTYQTSVFLTGSPLFAVVASPEYIDPAMQMETVISNQEEEGCWKRDLMLFFRDGFKYNFSAVEAAWKEKVTTSVETDLAFSAKEGKPKKIIWSGNDLKRLDPYNTFLDPRVPPTECSARGEFIGYDELVTRIDLKQYIEELPDKIIANIPAAFASGNGAASSSYATDNVGYYIPSINPEINEQSNKSAGTNWLAWASLSTSRNGLEYKDMYELTTLYCRILPAEYSLHVSNRNIPQIYKLVIVNHEHIIYCERQTNAHNRLPIFIGQPQEDGLQYQTKSLAKNAQPFQEVASSLMNSVIASRRRAISDRVLYDPSRITSAHINSANPSAKIPVRPAAYGRNISESVYQFPYREDQAGINIQHIGQIVSLGNNLNGQNQVSQGQFVKGNKTREEFDTTMSNANGRDQMTSILLEAQVFSPIKKVLKLNILQYQGGTTVYNKDKNRMVEIDPVQLRKAVLNFQVSDGLIPSSKLIDADSYTAALQVLGSSPNIAGSYNIGPLFSYLMKVKGAKIGEFEKSQEQQAYEQALGAWQQLALAYADKGVDPKELPPQPTPDQFGYNPAGNTPAPTPDSQKPATPEAGPQ